MNIGTEIRKHPLIDMLNSIKQEISPEGDVNLEVWAQEKEDGLNLFRMAIPGGFFQPRIGLIFLEELEREKTVRAYFTEAVEPSLRRHREQYINNNDVKYFTLIKYRPSILGRFGFT